MYRNSLRALGLFMCVAAAVPASAQSAPPDSWQVTIAPYLMGAAMNGSMGVLGHDVAVDVSASDILDKLEWGAMGFAGARKGNWGFGGDAIWMSLGQDGTTPGAAALDARADVDQGAFSFYGIRRLGVAADAMFGARVNTLRAKLQVDRSSRAIIDGSQTWVDPIVGLQLRTPTAARWHAQMYTEIGGFGAGSTFTWQVFPTGGVNLARWMSLEFGYRWLDINYSNKQDNVTKFKYDVLAQGPVMGFAFRF